MSEEFKPFHDREEHRYTNKMTALIMRCRLVIKSATQAVDDLQRETEEHIESFYKRRRKTDKDKEDSKC